MSRSEKFSDRRATQKRTKKTTPAERFAKFGHITFGDGRAPQASAARQRDMEARLDPVLDEDLDDDGLAGEPSDEFPTSPDGPRPRSR